MATLVQFLAAGVNGAASGSATFLLRGTASSAQSVMYNEFEGLTQPATNVVTLDANGAAEIYVDAYVDVEIKNSAGTTLRTVTVGNSAPLVEVQSTSFKGTDYDGNPANTVGEPITLKAILDKWILSAGAPDWQVLLGGVATNLQTAFAQFAGIFINVKDPTYGAEGDGVTDDTTAIAAAIAAATAEGGIVVFPPGTYLVEELAITEAQFCLIGFGQATLRCTDGTCLILQDNTPAAVKVISGINFEGDGSATRALSLEGDQTVFVDGCTFDESGFTDQLVLLADDNGVFTFTRCKFLLDDAATEQAIDHGSGDDKRVIISDCYFEIPSGFSTDVLSGSCFTIDSCVFDASAVTSGTYYMLDAKHPATAGLVGGNVSNCKFIDGGSSGYVFGLQNVGANADFSESNNTFVGFTAPTALTDPGHIYDYSNAAAYNQTSRIRLGSREGKQLNFTNAASSSLSGTECMLVADTIVINHTNASNLAVAYSPGEKPIGLKWNVVVLNNSGGARDVVFQGTGQSVTESAVADGGRAFGSSFTYLETTDTVCSAVIGSGKATV